jgi:iron complex transport system substrate-binding protein
MTRLRRAIAPVAIAALFAAACGDDSTTETGTDVPATDAPRVVSLSATATEILFAIGAGPDVVAVDSFSNYPPEAPVTDLEAFTPNVEAIADLEPDLVTMQNNDPDAVSALEELGITVIARDAPPTFDGMYDQIEELGVATGREREAADLVSGIQDRIAELQADAPDAGGRTYYHELGTDYYSITSDTFIAQVYGLFGLTSIGDAADGEAFAGYVPLTEEYILASDPDLIFLADTRYEAQTAETVADRPAWGDLTAVRQGRVVELDDDVASRWGPRVVEFAETIADALSTLRAPETTGS